MLPAVYAQVPESALRGYPDSGNVTKGVPKYSGHGANRFLVDTFRPSGDTVSEVGQKPVGPEWNEGILYARVQHVYLDPDEGDQPTV